MPFFARNIRLPFRSFTRNAGGKRNFILLCSVVVGLLAGISAVLLKKLVEAMEHLSRYIAEYISGSYIFLFLPALGILLTVVYIRYINRNKIEKGIGKILLNINRRQSVIKLNNLWSHMISSSLTVGFGGSSGLEAPIVCMGAAVGSNTAKWLKFTVHERKILLASGSAAGIAAVFNSPIAGVLFAFEVLLGETSIPAFIPLLAASASATIVSKLSYSGQLFHLAASDWKFSALPFYVLLGLGGGLLSCYISYVARKLEHGIFASAPLLLRPLFGGAILGLMVFLFPPLLGEGYYYLQEVLSGHLQVLQQNNLFGAYMDQDWFIGLFILLIVLLKIVAAGITIGSGGNGGTFAPTMFTGGFLGLLVAFLANQTGWVQLSYSNFVAVGMAAVLSGVMHAPLTAIFLIAEISGGYALLIPLMIVSTCSYFMNKAFFHHNIYWHELIKGKQVVVDKDKEILEEISVKSLVNTNFEVIFGAQKMKDAIGRFAIKNASILPVVDAEHQLIGVLVPDDMRRYLLEEDLEGEVQDYMSDVPGLIDVNDDSMESVMEQLDNLQVWTLPVVDEGRFIGFISKSSVFSVYRKVLQRKQAQLDIFQ
ncbi:MAG: chloride channel protein [Mucilaginibacter polytrichastri]|nr:chloride channel protein [Mucilaginibacter polytrichastri]